MTLSQDRHQTEKIRRFRRRFPKATRRTLRAMRAIQQINLRALIDSVFRYIQMVSVMTVIVSIVKIVDPDSAGKIRFWMSLGAGFYLGIPVSRWAIDNLPARLRSKRVKGHIRFLFSASTSLAICNVTLTRTAYLEALFSTTVKIDEKAARERYARWYMDDLEKSCVMGGRGVPWAAIHEKCFRHRTLPVPPAERYSRAPDQ